MSDADRPDPPSPAPALGRFDAIAIIVGIVIGAGIFKTPSLVAGAAGDAGWMLAAWVLGAAISLIGALCYAELATTFPDAGGDYHFLMRAYGRPISFLFAWARITVITSGSIALLAFVFGDYMMRVVPVGPGSGAGWAAVVVVALTAINVLGIRASATTQNILTAVEIVGLLAVIVAGVIATPAAATATPPPFAASPVLGMFGLAMVFVLLTYGGWNEAAYISAELKGGRRAIVGNLVWSLVIIAAIYLAVNLSLLRGLGLEGMAASKAAGADVMERAFGPRGSQLIGLIVAVAALTSINATMIVGARTNYAMGRDWWALRFMGAWNTSRAAPVSAFLVQGAIALALIAFGALQKDGFAAMVEFTAPVFWFFFLLTGLAVFVLRRREAATPRPFRVPLYPFTPLLFCGVCAYLLYSSLTYAASQDAVHVSLLVMAGGVVALLLTRSAGRHGPGDSPARD